MQMEYRRMEKLSSARLLHFGPGTIQKSALNHGTDGHCDRGVAHSDNSGTFRIAASQYARGQFNLLIVKSHTPIIDGTAAPMARPCLPAQHLRDDEDQDRAAQPSAEQQVK
jgi:hypothetical protein